MRMEKAHIPQGTSLSILGSCPPQTLGLPRHSAPRFALSFLQLCHLLHGWKRPCGRKHFALVWTGPFAAGQTVNTEAEVTGTLLPCSRWRTDWGKLGGREGGVWTDPAALLQPSVVACFFRTPQWHFNHEQSLRPTEGLWWGGQQGWFVRSAVALARCSPWVVKAGSAFIPLATGRKGSQQGC